MNMFYLKWIGFSVVGIIIAYYSRRNQWKNYNFITFLSCIPIAILIFYIILENFTPFGVYTWFENYLISNFGFDPEPAKAFSIIFTAFVVVATSVYFKGNKKNELIIAGSFLLAILILLPYYKSITDQYEEKHKSNRLDLDKLAREDLDNLKKEIDRKNSTINENRKTVNSEWFEKNSKPIYQSEAFVDYYADEPEKEIKVIKYLFHESYLVLCLEVKSLRNDAYFDDIESINMFDKTGGKFTYNYIFSNHDISAIRKGKTVQIFVVFKDDDLKSTNFSPGKISIDTNGLHGVSWLDKFNKIIKYSAYELKFDLVKS